MSDPGFELVLSPRGGLAFGAQPTSPLIQAQQFELVDATGAVRGVLRMAPEGTGPEVALLDEAGHRRAAMNQNAEGKYSFVIFDASGTHRIGVGTTKRGFTGLNVRPADGSGVIRVNLYADDDGQDSGFRAWDARRSGRRQAGLSGGRPRRVRRPRAGPAGPSCLAGAVGSTDAHGGCPGLAMRRSWRRSAGNGLFSATSQCLLGVRTS